MHPFTQSTRRTGLVGRVVVTSALLLALSLALTGCATPPPPVRPAPLLHDTLFERPAQLPDAGAVFTMSPAMQAFASTELRNLGHSPDPRQALIHALYRNRLRLLYDASTTRNAAEAFDAQTGNCLSLVIMTASFARHLDLPVGFQAVQTDAFYSRSGDLHLTSGHVNLVLEPPKPRQAFTRTTDASLTIDFLPQDELRGQLTRPLDNDTVVAMYFNNRAAELLAAGRTTDAYWHARAAVLQAPGFFTAVNTLGVIYSRAGHADAAEAAYRRTLEGDPDNISALSNLVRLLERQSRSAELPALASRLAQLQPVPPFQNFYLGRSAMDAGDYAGARDLFLRELRLQPYQDEVHFWAAQAYWQLGRKDDAAKHLSRALTYSATPGLHERYAAKLDWLRHNRVQ